MVEGLAGPHLKGKASIRTWVFNQRSVGNHLSDFSRVPATIRFAFQKGLLLRCASSVREGHPQFFHYHNASEESLVVQVVAECGRWRYGEE